MRSDASPRSTAVSQELSGVAERYDRRSKTTPRWPSVADRYFLERRWSEWLLHLTRTDAPSIEGATVVEFGAGGGGNLTMASAYRPDLSLIALELLPERCRDLRESARALHVIRGTATSSPLRSESCDVAIQATMMSSILDSSVRRTIASEIDRVLRPGGTLLWFDLAMDNPRNPDVRGVPVAQVRELFPGYDIRLSRNVLAPPIVRRLGRYLHLFAPVLQRVPGLCGHLVGAARKSEGQGG
jgi:SAM-dependent methyltransferase